MLLLLPKIGIIYYRCRRCEQLLPLYVDSAKHVARVIEDDTLNSKDADFGRQSQRITKQWNAPSQPVADFTPCGPWTVQSLRPCAD